MTRRAALFVAASLWTALTLLNPVSAQNRVPLRASHQGQFLPSGTELIVLTKDAHVQRGGRYQPEFLPTTGFPRRGSGSTEKDRLGRNGRSGDRYARTQTAGHLYFIYALAPDSTLYWSYSAQRDSLKYDVVSSGVMSVAPVMAGDTRKVVLDSYFNRRVTVVMPADEREGEKRSEKRSEKRQYAEAGENNRDDSRATDDGTDEPADGRTGDDGTRKRLTQDGAAPASETPARMRSAESSEISLVQDGSTAARIPALVAENPVGSVADPTGHLPPFVVYPILVFLIAAAAVPAVLARKYRRELKQVRREMLALRDRASFEKCDGHIHQQIQDAERRLKRVEEDYESLLLRYRAYEKDIETQRV